MLLDGHIKELRLPTILREFEVARQCATKHVGSSGAPNANPQVNAPIVAGDEERDGIDVVPLLCVYLVGSNTVDLLQSLLGCGNLANHCAGAPSMATANFCRM